LNEFGGDYRSDYTVGAWCAVNYSNVTRLSTGLPIMGKQVYECSKAAIEAHAYTQAARQQ
jgi:hypothetical protein